MAALPVVLALAGGAIGAVGAVQNARAQNAAAKFNAQVAEQNSVIAGQQGAIERDAMRKRAYMQLSQIRANAGASGLGDSVSALDVLGQSAADATYDDLNQQWQTKLKQTGFANDASLSRAQGKAAMQSGYLSAASTLLSAGAQAYTLNRVAGGGGGYTGSTARSGSM